MLVITRWRFFSLRRLRRLRHLLSGQLHHLSRLAGGAENDRNMLTDRKFQGRNDKKHGKTYDGYMMVICWLYHGYMLIIWWLYDDYMMMIIGGLLKLWPIDMTNFYRKMWISLVVPCLGPHFGTCPGRIGKSLIQRKNIGVKKGF